MFWRTLDNTVLIVFPGCAFAECTLNSDVMVPELALSVLKVDCVI